MNLKQKKYILPIILLLLSAFVLFKIIFPEFISILNIKNQITGAVKETQNLRNIIDAVNIKFNDKELDKDLSIVNSVLPPGKDILNLFFGITNASIASGVNIKGFSFALGELAKADVKNQAPAVSLSLNATADDLSSIINYSNKLYNSVPFSKINKISFSREKGATFDIDFYYKPYDLTFISNNQNILALQDDQVNLINTLGKWIAPR